VRQILARPRDASADAERVQIDLLRAAPVSRRMHLAWSLSAGAMSAARRAIARENPDASRSSAMHFVAVRR
jgi:hypothetical protein